MHTFSFNSFILSGAEPDCGKSLFSVQAVIFYNIPHAIRTYVNTLQNKCIYLCSFIGEMHCI